MKRILTAEIAAYQSLSSHWAFCVRRMQNGQTARAGKSRSARLRGSRERTVT